MQVTLVGKNPTDAEFQAVTFDVVIPRERLVVKELVEAGRKSTQEGAPAVAYLRLCAAAIGLCVPDFTRALAESGITFARSGYSALAYGGQAYAWLSEARSIDDSDIVDAGVAILKACHEADAAWTRQQEAIDAARKACRARQALGTGASTP